MTKNTENKSSPPTVQVQGNFWTQANPESKMTLMGVIGAALIGGFFLLISTNGAGSKGDIEKVSSKITPQTNKQNSPKNLTALDEKEYLLEGLSPAKIMSILYSRSDSSDRKYMALEYERKYIQLSGWTAKITEKSTPSASGGHVLSATSEGVNLRIFSEEDLRVFQIGDDIKLVGEVFAIDAYGSVEWDKITVMQATLQLYLNEKSD